MTEVSFRSLQRLQQALANLSGPQLEKLGERAGRKIGEQMKNRLSRYPGRPSYPLKWASDKQRKWWFASRRADGLDPRYTRRSDAWSQRLGQQWTVDVQKGGAVLGNRATYAANVQSAEYQTGMHKTTGWTTDKEAADEVIDSGVLERIVMAEIKTMIDTAMAKL